MEEKSKTLEGQAQDLSIVVKLPMSVEDRLHTFPALHLIRESFPSAVIHFVTPKHQMEILYLLPFKAFYHEWDENEIKTPMDVHRFCANMKIGIVNIYLSFTDTLNDACLGQFLRANRRIGFASGVKSFFYTIPIKRPINYHRGEEFLGVYKTLTNNSIADDLKVNSREMDNFYPDGAPYVAVDLYPLDPEENEEDWIKYFSFFEGKQFVLFASAETEKSAWHIQNLVPKLSTRNTYKILIYKNWIELGRVLSQARGVICNLGSVALLSTYAGTATIIMVGSEDPKLSAPFYFFADWLLLDTKDPSVSHANPSDLIKGKPRVHPDVLFEKTIELIKLF